MAAVGGADAGATAAHAGPESPSSFEAVQYEAQKMLYDWNFHEPNDGLRALGYVRNHLAALEEFGDLENSEIIRRARR